MSVNPFDFSAWVDGAFVWDWDGVPPEARRHDDRVRELLGGRLPHDGILPKGRHLGKGTPSLTKYHSGQAEKHCLPTL